MQEALRIIIAKSERAAPLALHTMRVARVQPSSAGRYYAQALQAALTDPNAVFTPEERQVLAEAIPNDDGMDVTRSFTLRIRLTESERAELQRLADEVGQTMSEYARRRIFERLPDARGQQ